MSVKNDPPALPNLREAGGIPAAGGSIRSGLLFRRAASLGDYLLAHGLSVRQFERLGARLVGSR
ncbi:hypothetical protein CQ019_17630 [Arthrobacter sp. MYb229]|uniref:hypothetical protein n=1 Tax=unclassified Arthrobacter TaxID=235627 RepID=UPI000CFBC89D|nr:MULTISPECIES: hypothetical protein [unclassified Arthrobacter]PQZ98047.1 hypothetical protein CQ019_17630 [Arthrobacter sp. MYb229]PRB46929.1 hypothetical protein CQ013_17655 [Arthrobacter sp. MYb216]